MNLLKIVEGFGVDTDKSTSSKLTSVNKEIVEVAKELWRKQQALILFVDAMFTYS